MRCRSELGPGCPNCGSGEWRFRDAREEFHREDDIPLPEVSAAAACEECETTFYVDLRLPEGSVWRSAVVPRTYGPLRSFAWLDETLYAFGRVGEGRADDDEEGHYRVEYGLVAVWEPRGTE